MTDKTVPVAAGEPSFASGNAQFTKPENRAFYPALDGLRAIAFIAVFFTHYGSLIKPTPIFDWGWVGVDVFFVLSGFLITGILFDSIHRPDFFRAFYIRRSLRIFPLFYGFWLVLLLLTPLLHVHWNRYNFTFVTYIGNFFLAHASTDPKAHPALIFFEMKHVYGFNVLDVYALWSLCVEEQFYIFWPAIVWLIRSRVLLFRLCIAAMLIAPIARFLYFHAHPDMLATGGLYYPTWSRVDTLLFGAALALWRRGPTPDAGVVRRISWATLFGAPCLLAVGMVAVGAHAKYPNFDPVVSTIGFSLIATAASALLLLVLDPSTFLFRALRIRPLTSLGRISYGLYFFHLLPLITISGQGIRLKPRHLDIPIFIGTFACTFLMAWLSFNFYESKFLSLKEKWAPSARPETAA